MITCECGRQFSTIQGFNAHSTYCDIHFEFTDGYERIRIEELRERRRRKNDNKIRQLSIQNKEKLDEFISQKRTCRCCGKVMTQMYGQGIFCSKRCVSKYASSLNDRELQ